MPCHVFTPETGTGVSGGGNRGGWGFVYGGLLSLILYTT